MLRGEYLEFLKQLRIAKGQGEAVALSDLLGRSSSYVSKVETGSTAPSAEYAEGLVKVLGLDAVEGRQLHLLQRLYDSFEEAAKPSPRMLVDWFGEYVATVREVRSCGVTAVPRYLRWPGKRYPDEAVGAFPVRQALAHLPSSGVVRSSAAVRTVVFADALRRYARGEPDPAAAVDKLAEYAKVQFGGNLAVVPSVVEARTIPTANFYLLDSWLAVIDTHGGPLVTCRPEAVREMAEVFDQLWTSSEQVGRHGTPRMQARLREIAAVAEDGQGSAAGGARRRG